ncbi:hypothetical protein T492DRAFT_1115390 [Pavlovales sp. CCMP2436]|nr:hypothetical protein T492DRAFT_1115390 [Pavlovales sp. CCMP2436]
MARARTAFAVEAWIARAHARLARVLDLSKAYRVEAKMPGVLLLTVAHSDLLQTSCPDLPLATIWMFIICDNVDTERPLADGDSVDAAPALWPGDVHAARSSSPDLNLCSAAARAERLPPLAEALASATSRIAFAQNGVKLRFFGDDWAPLQCSAECSTSLPPSRCTAVGSPRGTTYRPMIGVSPTSSNLLLSMKHRTSSP